MTQEERRTFMTDTAPGGGSVTTRRIVETRPSSGEIARRVVIVIFGIIQLLIALRVLLLLLDAQETNAIVRGILDLSEVFVGPFEGILRTDALHAGASILDVTALVAFVGWTVLELVVLWIVGVFRREPA